MRMQESTAMLRIKPDIDPMAVVLLLKGDNSMNIFSFELLSTFFVLVISFG